MSLILFIGDVVKSPAQEIRGMAQTVRSHLKARARHEYFCAVVTAGNPHTGVGRVWVSQAVERHHLTLIYSEHLANSQTLFAVHFQVVGAIWQEETLININKDQLKESLSNPLNRIYCIS